MLQGNAYTKFRAKFRTDCVGPKIESNLTPKIEYTLIPTNYRMPSRDFNTLPHESPDYLMSTPFLRVKTLKFCTRVECAPAKTSTNVFSFFLPKMWGSLKTKISPKYLAKKKDWKTRQGHIKHLCKTSGSITQKRRGHWHLKEFGASCLNHQVRTIFDFFPYTVYQYVVVNNPTPFVYACNRKALDFYAFYSFRLFQAAIVIRTQKPVYPRIFTHQIRSSLL